MGQIVFLQNEHLFGMAAGRHSSYLGKVRLLLLLLVLGTPCVVAQEDKSKLRTWTSSIGTKIEAELVSTTGDEVTLKTKAGRTLTVPLNKLSKADQEFAAAQSSPQEPAKGGVPVTPDLKYETEDDTVTITGCDRNASGALTIPATIEGKTVTSIGNLAFVGCGSLTSITIPDGVTSIGESAFYGCSNLTTIEVGAGNISYADVDGVLFNKKKTILVTYPKGKKGTNYDVPDGVTSIGERAFSDCSSLPDITIPDSVTSIGDSAFVHCKSLTSITIPDGVTSIGDSAFSQCKNLTSITIGNSVTSIGEDAFFYCESLTAVTFLGDAPKAGEALFYKSTPTIYRKPEAKGWGKTWGGRPVKLISEKP